jgi:hypothetical protein
MRLGDLVFVVILVCIPLWLVVRAWRRYLALDAVSARELFQMRVGVAFITITTSMWLAAFALMVLEDHSCGARSIAQNISPAIMAVVNLAFCAGAFICSGLGNKAKGLQATRLRRAIAASAGFLVLPWLFLLANPH